MRLIQGWLARLFGLRQAVLHHLEVTTRLDTEVATAVALAETAKEVDQYAASLEATHPALAATLRAKVAALLGAPLPPAEPTSAPPTLTEGPPPGNGPSRPKKAALPAPATPDRTTPTGGK